MGFEMSMDFRRVEKYEKLERLSQTTQFFKLIAHRMCLAEEILFNIIPNFFDVTLEFVWLMWTSVNL